jgi:DNA-binding beta-propeller fold protein YncE
MPISAIDALICLRASTGLPATLACNCEPPGNDCGAFELSFGAGKLAEPHGIAFDAAGNVYVADTFLAKIVKFSPTGTFVKSWGGEGTANGKLLDPRGIAVGPNDRVYVADNGNYRVQVFDTSGAFIKKFGSMCFIAQGTGCVDPDGSGPLELGDGQFIEPYGIAIDGSGDVYVTDASNHRVEVFSAEGAFKRKWSLGGGVPRQLAVSNTTVYVGPGDHTIATFSRTGVPGSSFAGFCRLQDGAGCVDPDGGGPLALGDGQLFQFLGHIAFARDSLFVADDGNRRMQWLTADGQFRAKWGSECCYIDGIGCVDPDGPGPLNIGDGQFCGPTGVAVDAQGRVYVSDLNARVQRFGCADLK